MLVVMRHDATPEQINRVVAVIEELGYEARPLPGAQRTAVGIVGNDGRIDAARLSGLDGVRDLLHVSLPYRQVSREWRPDDTIVQVGSGIAFGDVDIPIIAGPCSVESERQLLDIAHQVRQAGATMLRGGAFKPRSSPYAFQGIGSAGLKHLARARAETGLLVVTEAMDPESVPLVEEYADVIQIGARNMQNYSLLRRVGRTRRPVLLKRGLSATITEWLLSAEYILAGGNHQVVLCERGVRGFDPGTRNLFDLTAIPAVKHTSHLPVMADPSHGTGSRDLVIPMSRAAVAAGADGLMVEVHVSPDQALSDGTQSLYPHQFADLVRQIRRVAEAVGRRVTAPTSAPVTT